MNRLPQTASSRRRQRGISMFGLMFWAILIGFFAYIGVVTFPTVNEYATIKRTVEKIAAENPTTVAEVRTAHQGVLHCKGQAQRVQDLDGLRDDFGADAVTREDCEFHFWVP